MNLRTVNPDLKILLAIGGWTHGTAPFTAVVDDPNDMAAFAANALTYLKTYQFDGLDLDWEYPGGNGSPPEDKQRFTSFVQKLRQVFDDDGVVNNRAPLLLTAAVAAGKSTIDNAYEIDLISRDLDFINLMSYDLHGSWEATTGHHSALFGRAGEVGTAAYMNVDYAVNYWINLGAPPEKLVLGIGLYGRSFTLASFSNTGVGASAVGAGSPGTYTGEAGLLAYYEVCYNLKYNGWTRQWHSEHKAPYAYHGTQWIGYDDGESINIKIDYIKTKGLGGGMVWSLDQDDFSNSCGDGPYPLMNLLRSGLARLLGTSTLMTSTFSSSTSLFSTLFPSTTQEQAKSPLATIDNLSSSKSVVTRTTQNLKASTNNLNTPSPTSCEAPQPCVDGQLYGDRCDIHKYYQCASGIAWQFQCAAGTVWDERIKNCNWDYLVLTSSAPCGCGPPASCVNGRFYEDKCDMKLYYQCAHGIPYPFECHPGTLWDVTITSCNWDYAVPSRSPPLGSDCSSYGTTSTPVQQTTVGYTKTSTHVPNTTNQEGGLATTKSNHMDSSSVEVLTSSTTVAPSSNQTASKIQSTQTSIVSQSYPTPTDAPTNYRPTDYSTAFTDRGATFSNTYPEVKSTSFTMTTEGDASSQTLKQITTSSTAITTNYISPLSQQQTTATLPHTGTTIRAVSQTQQQPTTTLPIAVTTNGALSQAQQQTTTETQSTTACGPPDTCPFPAWDSGSISLTSHILLIPTAVLLVFASFNRLF
ncbi:chitotriosidase-1-like [Ostrea edulis]|uniref:chitotriosidase-1-like n=1 Tax=Ostrea edulis TaxID=37623 RepID=UPI0024AFA07C|nr:chitotriosidase-1-like [Ostrea edulis]